MIRRHRSALTALLLLLAPATLTAQVRDDGAEVTTIAEGVYAIIHEDATDAWPHGNTGVIVGDSGVLVIDATYLPSRAAADIALIRQLTDKPIRQLVITHWHFDHNNGISAYKQAYPDIEIISGRLTRDYVEVNNHYWPKMSTAQGSSRRVELAVMAQRLNSGKNADGSNITAAERADLQKRVPQRQKEMEELANLQVVTSNRVFDDSLTLDIGGRIVQLRNHGRANSPDDISIYLPAEQILFTGDILVQAPVPYTFGVYPLEWIEVMRDLEALPVTAVVPGHGPVFEDHTYTRQVRELFEAAVAAVRPLVLQGRTVDQIQAAVKLEDQKRRVPAWREASQSDWESIVAPLVVRTFNGLRGQP